MLGLNDVKVGVLAVCMVACVASYWMSDTFLLGGSFQGWLGSSDMEKALCVAGSRGGKKGAAAVTSKDEAQCRKDVKGALLQVNLGCAEEIRRLGQCQAEASLARELGAAKVDCSALDALFVPCREAAMLAHLVQRGFDEEALSSVLKGKSSKKSNKKPKSKSKEKEGAGSGGGLGPEAAGEKGKETVTPVFEVGTVPQKKPPALP